MHAPSCVTRTMTTVMASHLPQSLLSRAIHNHASATTTLQPSTIIKLSSPRISAILSSYGGTSSESGCDNEGEAALSSWETPHTHMPILTQKQLEMSLLEIQRRKNRRQRKQNEHGRQQSQRSSLKKEAAILVPVCTVQGIPSILFTRRSSQLSSHASQISFPGGYYDDTLDNAAGGGVNYCWKNKLMATALREMHEELQYDLEQLGIERHANYFATTNKNLQQHDSTKEKPTFMTVLGQTQPVPSMTGSIVTPIIGTINYDLPCHTTSEFKNIFPGNPDEVDWIFTVPIRDLILGETSEPLQRWSATNYSNNDNKDGKKNTHEYLGPVFPVPDDDRKEEGDKIWGLTAIVLRPLLRNVFRPVFGENGL